MAQVDGRSLLRRQPLHAASPSFAPDCFCATPPLISVSSCDGLDMRPPDSAVRERARRGDRDGAIPQLRQAVDDMFNAGQLGYRVTANALFVEMLLERGRDRDLADAEAEADQLAAVSAHHAWVISDV